MAHTSTGRRSATAILLCGLIAAVGIGGFAWFASTRDTPGPADSSRPVRTTTTVQAEFLAMDLPMSIASADAIVVGRVDGKQWTSRGVQMSEWGRARQRGLGYSDADIEEQVSLFEHYVFTRSRFKIDRTLKGALPDGVVEIWCVGGEFEGHRLEALGYPQLRPGRQYVVFLGRGFDGAYGPTAVYEVRGGRATTTDQGRNDDMPVEELFAIIEEHKDDPFPWVPSSELIDDMPDDDSVQQPEESSQTVAP